ncbi:MAG: D-alanine--D-alanine ligase, partial [Thermoanaerobacterales bacterium]|nr:D-alanine--D-alanine ligase [Thermoanaerobacterales bacterium]
GLSAEREVSLASGRAVMAALQDRGCNVVAIDIGENPPRQIMEAGIDVAFLALHGKGGEDGTIQGVLEMLQVPYTGSGVLASAIAMHKTTTKRLLLSEGLPTPRFIAVQAPTGGTGGLEDLAGEVLDQVGLPMVIKPPMQGSTIGITFAHRREDVLPGLELAFRYGREALAEEFVQGIEVTAGLLGNQDPVVLPLIEIVSATGVYDYHAKYTPGQSTHIIPPHLPQAVQDEIGGLARRVFKLLGCSGLARVDFIVGLAGPMILEVNTLPGMTAVSLYPDAARAAGIGFPDLCLKLVELATET